MLESLCSSAWLVGSRRPLLQVMLLGLLLGCHLAFILVPGSLVCLGGARSRPWSMVSVGRVHHLAARRGGAGGCQVLGLHLMQRRCSMLLRGHVWAIRVPAQVLHRRLLRAGSRSRKKRPGSGGKRQGRRPCSQDPRTGLAAHFGACSCRVVCCKL